MAQPVANSTFRLPPSALADRLEVFFGAASPAAARIYARLELSDGAVAAGYGLSGRVVGPECTFSHTLPARMPMMDRSEGKRLLLEAVVPDPCFWTPELPFLYRVQIELRRGGESIVKCERIVGIRRFGVRDRALNFDGKRFVLRGVRMRFETSDLKFQNSDLKSQISNLKSQIQGDAAFLRETWTALVVAQPDEELCEFASRTGLLLVAELRGASSIASEIVRLAKWPAVAIAIVDGDAKLPPETNDVARNLVLAQAIATGQQVQLADWAQVAVVEVAELEKSADKIAGCDLPIVAYRPELGPVEIETARAACDRLQRDLAQYGDFAGYLV